MKTRISLILLAMVLVQAFAAIYAWAGDCPNGEAYLKNGQYEDAEAEARQCVKQHPNNEYNWFLLSRAIAFQGRHEEARQWADRAYLKNKDDKDLAVWRVRLIAWQGNHDLAWQEAMKLPEDAFYDKDSKRMLADLAFWRSEYEEGVKRYDAFLKKWPRDHMALRNRGICYKNLGKRDKAYADFESLCNMSSAERDSNCKYLYKMQEENARFKLTFAPRYWTAEKEYKGGGTKIGSAQWEGFIQFDARVWNKLHIGAELDHRARSYGDETLTDQFASLYASYKWKMGFSLYGAAGATIEPDFSPIYSAIIEPGYGFDFGLELYLRYWRMQFADTGVHVISPAAIYTISPFSIYLRYFYGIDDDSDIPPSNAVIGKLTYVIKNLVPISAGGGYGDGADYLRIDDIERKGYYTLFGGIGWKINRWHKLGFDYVYRNEVATNDRIDVVYIQHTFILSYSVKF